MIFAIASLAFGCLAAAYYLIRCWRHSAKQLKQDQTECIHHELVQSPKNPLLNSKPSPVLWVDEKDRVPKESPTSIVRSKTSHSAELCADVIQNEETPFFNSESPSLTLESPVLLKREDHPSQQIDAANSLLVLDETEVGRTVAGQQNDHQTQSAELDIDTGMIDENRLLPPLRKDGRIRSKKEKKAFKQYLKQLSVQGLAFARPFFDSATFELNQILTDATNEKQLKLAGAFEEFVRNEQHLKEVLEELQAYQTELNRLVESPKKIGEIAPQIRFKVIKKLNKQFIEFNRVLEVASRLSCQISSLSLQELPILAEIFLETDFTPYLHSTLMQNHFNIILKEGDKKQKDLIINLFRTIRRKNPKKFKDKLSDIDGLVANIFQRIPRYPLMLKALLDQTKEFRAIFKVVNECYIYALAWSDAVNAWDGQ